MTKVVLSECFGGFGLSEKAYEFLGLPWDGFGYAYNNYEMRTDPKLIECVETLGEEANGEYAELEIEEYDDYNYDYCIDDYDGLESLGLTPKVHKTELKTMTTDEIAEYLTSLGITVVE